MEIEEDKIVEESSSKKNQSNQELWERFEDGLSRNGTTYKDIKGIAEDNKIENLIRKYGKIEHDLDVAKVITMFKNGGPQGSPAPPPKIAYYQDQYFDRPAFHINAAANPVPPKLTEHKRLYLQYIQDPNDEDQFVKNFLAALRLEPSVLPFTYPRIHWTNREIMCLGKVIKRIYQVERGQKHISSILVGLKGVGKTTLIQMVCIMAGLLSDALFIIYVDITNLGLVTPLQMLNDAIALGASNHKPFLTLQQALSYLGGQGKKLFTVIDEAYKYYVRENEKTYEESRNCILQVYHLGIAPGSSVILCGSSSKLTCLALPDNHKSTEVSKSLLKEYPGYSSLNDQKFIPIVLSAVKRSELAGYLEFYNLKHNEESVSYYWKRTAGSVRFIVFNQELASSLPSSPHDRAVLLWLYQQQTTDDPDKLESISVTRFEEQVKYWRDNGILDFPLQDLYEMIDEGWLSCDWESITSTITKIGFGYPGQFVKLLEADHSPTELSTEVKSWLVDPKHFDEQLEGLVASCFYNLPMTKCFFLCVGSKPSDCKVPHEDVFLEDWDPKEKHQNIAFKVFPDNFGIDVLYVTAVDDKRMLLDGNQIKLGGSRMKTTGLKDTVEKMIERFKQTSVLLKQIQKKFPKLTCELTKRAFITRVIAKQAEPAFEKASIIVYNRQDMYNKVWSTAVKDFAEESVGYIATDPFGKLFQSTLSDDKMEISRTSDKMEVEEEKESKKESNKHKNETDLHDTRSTNIDEDFEEVEEKMSANKVERKSKTIFHLSRKRNESETEETSSPKVKQTKKTKEVKKSKKA